MARLDGTTNQPNPDADLPPHTTAPKSVDDETVEAFARACIAKQKGQSRPNGVIVYLAKQVIRLLEERRKQ